MFAGCCNGCEGSLRVNVSILGNGSGKSGKVRSNNQSQLLTKLLHRAHSSMVEQGTHTPLVLGSNPGGPTIRKHWPSLRVAAFLFERPSLM